MICQRVFTKDKLSDSFIFIVVFQFWKRHLPYELDNYNNLANIKLAKEKLQSLYFYYQKVQCLNYSYSMKIP